MAFRSWLAAGAFILLLTNAGAAQDDKERLDECRRLAEPFELIALPSVADRKYVIFNTGQSWEYDDRQANTAPVKKLAFHYAQGWLLAETPTEVTILGEGLETITLKRNAQLPANWSRFAASHPADRPLPGACIEVDFEQLCREAVEPVPTYEQDREAASKHTFDDMRRRGAGGLASPTDLVLRVRWELERGQTAMALRLTDAARKIFGERKGRGQDEPASLEEAVVFALAENLRWRAINAASAGAPRSRLVETWRLIAKALPKTSLSAEASRMVELYEQLLAEDATFVEPSAEVLAGMNDAGKVTYWMHKLREENARQWGQPGGVAVLGDWSGIPPGKANPAEELWKLGPAALPEVMAHLDDERPTRSVGYWRDFAPGSFYLFRYSDCCEQIFQAITGEEIYRRRSTSGSPSNDKVLLTMKQAAYRWYYFGFFKVLVCAVVVGMAIALARFVRRKLVRGVSRKAAIFGALVVGAAGGVSAASCQFWYETPFSLRLVLRALPDAHLPFAAAIGVLAFGLPALVCFRLARVAPTVFPDDEPQGLSRIDLLSAAIRASAFSAPAFLAVRRFVVVSPVASPLESFMPQLRVFLGVMLSLALVALAVRLRERSHRETLAPYDRWSLAVALSLWTYLALVHALGLHVGPNFLWAA